MRRPSPPAQPPDEMMPIYSSSADRDSLIRRLTSALLANCASPSYVLCGLRFDGGTNQSAITACACWAPAGKRASATGCFPPQSFLRAGRISLTRASPPHLCCVHYASPRICNNIIIFCLHALNQRVQRLQEETVICIVNEFHDDHFWSSKWQYVVHPFHEPRTSL